MSQIYVFIYLFIFEKCVLILVYNEYPLPVENNSTLYFFDFLKVESISCLH